MYITQAMYNFSILLMNEKIYLLLLLLVPMPAACATLLKRKINIAFSQSDLPS